MNEIVRMVAERTGIGEDKAQQAVQVVVEQLRKRLPAPLASHLDSFVSGQANTAEGEGGIAGKIGNLMGRKSA
jgi:hypothetical protein